MCLPASPLVQVSDMLLGGKGLAFYQHEGDQAANTCATPPPPWAIMYVCHNVLRFASTPPCSIACAGV